MRTNSILVIIGFLLAFGAGYLLFGQNSSPQQEDSTVEEAETDGEDQAGAEDLASMIPEEAEVLSRNGCLGCHSVDSIGAVGGDIGPDLSRAYPEMKAKHGVELDAFLQEPTAAVMATVIADKPLKDEEREQIVKVLQEAAKKLESSSGTADDEKKKETDATDENE